jgi:PAS domain S-box-containing protein
MTTYRPSHGESELDTSALGRLLEQIEETAASRDGSLLRRLARQVSGATGTRWGLITELVEGNRARAVAFWAGNGFAEPFEYDLYGTPYEHVFTDNLAYCGENVGQAFPHAGWLNELPAEAVAAIPLFKADCSPLGHLSVIHDEPLADEDMVLLTLRLFALRASAELERSAIERQLRASEENYRRLVEASPDIIFRIRLGGAGRMEYVNSAIEHITGYAPTEFYEDPELFLKVIAEPVEDLEKAFSGKAFHQSKIRCWKHKDGSDVWTEQHNIPIHDETGRLVAQQGVARDVTDRVIAERALSEQVALMAGVVEAIPDRLFRVSVDGGLRPLLADSARQPTDHPSSLEELLPGRALPKAREALLAALRNKGVQSLNYRVEVEGDIESVHELRIVPTRAGDAIAMVRDITGSSWLAAEDENLQVREDLEQKVERRAAARNPYSFTFRELTVLHLLVSGAADKQIATQLGISTYTVNRHVSNILTKMGASSRTEVGVRAIREDLLA